MDKQTKDFIDNAKDVTKPIMGIIMALLVFLFLLAMFSMSFGVEKIKLIRPFDDITYKVDISGRFGVDRPGSIGGNTYPHTGVDYKLERGTNLRASAGGVIINAEDSETGYGNWVVIDHGGGLTTIYAHLLRPEVRVGDKVEQGQIIGQVGRSGRAYGYHCHFEVRLKNRPIHPWTYIKDSI